MRKNVLVLASFPAPYRVGVFSRMIDEYDMDVFFGTSSNDNRNNQWFCQSGEVFTFYILGKHEANKRFRNALRKIKKYDFVLCYDVHQIPSYIAIIFCRFFRIPYFVNCDGAILKRKFFRDVVKRFIYQNAIGCFSSGNSAKEYYKFYGVNESRIHSHQFTSLNKSDILVNVPSIDMKKSLKHKIGIPNKKTIIAVGQFIPRKGFDILIKAWEKIHSDAQLIIIGGGNEKDQYEKYIQEHKILNIKLVDYLDKSLLFDYYQASDIFVLPTREDIWGLVVNEAMANGLPIITTNMCVAGNELIEDGKNGYIVGVDDVDVLAVKIKMLLSDDELRASMQQMNIELIQDWTIENIALNHINTINDVLGYIY